jgi:type IV pilus assembly protein PilE
MNRVKGFTLVELMIIVTIIGILAAIAIPSYSTYVLKAHRSAAVTGVLDLATRQARYYTTNNTYTTSMTALGYAADPMPLENANSHYYDLSISAGDADGFTVQAAPVGKQESDTCGTFIYDDLGQRSMSTDGGTVAECWKQ